MSKKKTEELVKVQLMKLTKFPRVGDYLYEFIERPDENALLVKYKVLPVPDNKTQAGLIKLEFVEEAPGYPKGTEVARHWTTLYRKILLEKRLAIFFVMDGAERIVRAKKFKKELWKQFLQDARMLSRKSKVAHRVDIRWFELAPDIPKPEIKPNEILGKTKKAPEQAALDKARAEAEARDWLKHKR